MSSHSLGIGAPRCNHLEYVLLVWLCIAVHGLDNHPTVLIDTGAPIDIYIPLNFAGSSSVQNIQDDM